MVTIYAPSMEAAQALIEAQSEPIYCANIVIGPYPQASLIREILQSE